MDFSVPSSMSPFLKSKAKIKCRAAATRHTNNPINHRDINNAATEAQTRTPDAGSYQTTVGVAGTVQLNVAEVYDFWHKETRGDPPDQNLSGSPAPD